ncbi:MAG TPA: pilus assembly protein N-terminal domain-containing protein [Methylomirabilota bacterium]|jgi:Flp pilus assembly secretin CpaC
MRAAALAVFVLGAALVATGAHAADNGKAGDTDRIYVTIDKTQVVELATPPTKVSVTNPGIADVVVMTPTRILVNGKATGETSLLLFYGTNLRHYDLIVQPPPTLSSRSPLVPDTAYPVEILRAGRPSHHLFVRDAESAWVPLGGGRLEGEALPKSEAPVK